MAKYVTNGAEEILPKHLNINVKSIGAVDPFKFGQTRDGSYVFDAGNSYKIPGKLVDGNIILFNTDETSDNYSYSIVVLDGKVILQAYM